MKNSKKQQFPSPVAAAILSDKVVIAYSLLLAPMINELRKNLAFFSNLILSFKNDFLLELENHCKNINDQNIRRSMPDSFTFYKNVFAFLTRLADYLMVDGAVAPIPSVDRLLQIVLNAPIEESSLNALASHLLYLIFRHKIWHIFNIVNKVSFKVSKDKWLNEIYSQKDLSSLSHALGTFLKEQDNSFISFTIGNVLIDYLNPVHQTLLLLLQRLKNVKTSVVSSATALTSTSTNLSQATLTSAKVADAPATSRSFDFPLLPPQIAQRENAIATVTSPAAVKVADAAANSHSNDSPLLPPQIAQRENPTAIITQVTAVKDITTISAPLTLANSTLGIFTPTPPAKPAATISAPAKPYSALSALINNNSAAAVTAPGKSAVRISTPVNRYSALSAFIDSQPASARMPLDHARINNPTETLMTSHDKNSSEEIETMERNRSAQPG